MKLGLLFSGGKDSTFAGYIACKESNYDLACAISIFSKNKESYMYHTPSIELTKKQSELMEIPHIVKETEGEKEKELEELEKAIKEAKEKYDIEGIVTGAVESIYQASRIQKICYELNLECFNPLWQKNQFELLNDLIDNEFEIILTGVFAYPLDKSWIGRRIDEKFIEEIRQLYEKYKINPAGEGGEFETMVVNCPLFKKSLDIKKINPINREGDNSWSSKVILEENK